MPKGEVYTVSASILSSVRFLKALSLFTTDGLTCGASNQDKLGRKLNVRCLLFVECFKLLCIGFSQFSVAMLSRRRRGSVGSEQFFRDSAAIIFGITCHRRAPQVRPA